MPRRRSTNLRSSRRRLFWARFLASPNFDPATSFKAAQPSNLLAPFESDYGADLFGFTVTRIRGNYSVAFDNTTATERSIYDVGIRIADQNAIDNLPTTNQAFQALLPSNDPHADWMFSTSRLMFSSPQTTASKWNQYEFDLDIKSQRRLDELGQSLYLMSGLSDITGTGTPTEDVRAMFDLHILCKRP